MKSYLSIFLVITAFCLISTSLYSQDIQKTKAESNSITFVKGRPITVDGVFSKDEWTDARRLDLPISANRNVNVYYKYDDNNLYFAFTMYLIVGTIEMRCPEILIDRDNRKGTLWLEGRDFWFHVSATDCYSSSGPNIYNNCLKVQTDWIANNFLEPNFNDIIEISIPLSKIGLTDLANKEIGIAFDVTNTTTLWEYWPINASNTNPSTWATANFENELSVEDAAPSKSSNDAIAVKDFFEIDESNLNLDVEVFNILGERSLAILNNTNKSIDLTSLAKGVYIVKIGNASYRIAKI